MTWQAESVANEIDPTAGQSWTLPSNVVGAAGAVVAEGKDCTHSHPLQHAVMVAIEAAAERDRRLWPAQVPVTSHGTADPGVSTASVHQGKTWYCGMVLYLSCGCDKSRPGHCNLQRFLLLVAELHYTMPVPSEALYTSSNGFVMPVAY